MVITVYDTATDGSDGLGLLTTLERATVTQTVSATALEGETTLQAENTPRVSIGAPALKGTSTTSDSSDASLTTFTSSNPTSSAPHTSDPTYTSNLVPTSTLSSTSAPTSTTTQLSTASIVGIAIGSVAAAVLILVSLFLALGFRIRLAKLPRQSTQTEAPGLRDERPVNLGKPYAKAELADSEYLQKVERLHERSKPELEGSTALKSVWRLFSIRSLRTRSLREGPAELAAEPLESGPHELPGEGMLQSSREEPRDTRDAT